MSKLIAFLLLLLPMLAIAAVETPSVTNVPPPATSINSVTPTAIPTNVATPTATPTTVATPTATPTTVATPAVTQPAAGTANTYSFGQVAENLLVPIDLMADFLDSACFLIGFSFLFAAVIKYFEHRRSPTMVPISTVIFLLVAGTALILMPFLGSYTESGVHYSLMTG